MDDMDLRMQAALAAARCAVMTHRQTANDDPFLVCLESDIIRDVIARAETEVSEAPARIAIYWPKVEWPEPRDVMVGWLQMFPGSVQDIDQENPVDISATIGMLFMDMLNREVTSITVTTTTASTVIDTADFISA